MNPHLASHSLAHAQQALLDALWTSSGSPAALQLGGCLESLVESDAQTWRGLQAYQANGHALAERALRAAYPVVDAVMGGPAFAMLARALWHRHPPQQGDMALWGDDLPGFIAQDGQLTELPWLADVARVEWALHQAATAADRWPDPASFSLLQQADPATLRLVLAPGLQVLPSLWPAASIVNAHLSPTPSLEEAWRLCRDRQAENTLVWRQGLKPRAVPIDAWSATFLDALLSGLPLTEALDAITAAAEADQSTFDFGAWLAQAFADGVVLGAEWVAPFTASLIDTLPGEPA